MEDFRPPSSTDSPLGEPPRSDSPHFLKAQDCLGNGKEQPKGQAAQLICSSVSLHEDTRLPLAQQGSQSWWFSPSCHRGPTKRRIEQRIKFPAFVQLVTFLFSLVQESLYHQQCAPCCSRSSHEP